MFEPSNATTPNKPVWHAPWKLSRIIRVDEYSVCCIAVDQRNEWFATGSTNGDIKIWDLYSGELKLSRSYDHGITDLAVGNHHLFSCNVYEPIKCWDVEHKKVIRCYGENLCDVYVLDFHDQLNLLVSGGSDGTVRLWDVRTKVQTHCLRGHEDIVYQVRGRGSEPHIISASYDDTICIWDIVAGKERIILTNPSKHAFRSFVLHPNLNVMITATVEDLKQWSIPDGVFIQNICSPGGDIVATNTDDVFVSNHFNGDLSFFDWSSGHNFQRLRSDRHSASLYYHAGIEAMTFDRTDSRLITCAMDKTIKVYVEDQNATEESHPLNSK